VSRPIRRTAVGLAITIALAGIAIGAASSGAARGDAASTSTTTTLAPPVQGTGLHQLFFSVDMVQGYQTAVKLPADAACSVSSLFVAGEVVVFRMYGVRIVNSDGNDLLNTTVKSAYVKIPGVTATIPLVYGTHPTKPAVSYWTAAWTVPKGYPLGTVNFSVTVTTDPQPKTSTAPAIPSETATLTAGNSPYLASPLTIVPSLSDT